MSTGLLDVLDRRTRYAVELRFGLTDGRKRSYREVGENLGVTGEAARFVVKRALNTLRDSASEVIDEELTQLKSGNPLALLLQALAEMPPPEQDS